MTRLEWGMTPEQTERFAQRWCENGHKFDGANFPTPEGVCPFCAWPEVKAERDRYYQLVAEPTEQPREPLHPSFGLHVQSASPALAASFER